jgi:DNA-binding response OmpR family regulator
MARILIVEDDLDYRDALSEILMTANYSVSVAGNGQEAFEFLKDNSVDLILLDLFMPKVDGLTFFYKLKNELNKDIPVIILTNLTETAYPEGIKDFIIKSDTNLDQVLEKVKLHMPQW